jgi:hypothetical protein
VAACRDSCPQSKQPAAVFYTLGYPMPLYFCVLVIGFILFEVQQLRESKLLKAVQIAYVVGVRYLEKTQESLRLALIAYCINFDKHS